MLLYFSPLLPSEQPPSYGTFWYTSTFAIWCFRYFGNSLLRLLFSVYVRLYTFWARRAHAGTQLIYKKIPFGTWLQLQERSFPTLFFFFPFSPLERGEKINSKKKKKRRSVVYFFKNAINIVAKAFGRFRLYTPLHCFDCIVTDRFSAFLSGVRNKSPSSGGPHEM